MSNYIKDIQFNLITPNTHMASHKQALLTMAQEAADYLNISEKILLTRIMNKEDIASSSIGDGVAIPHLKMRRARSPFAMLMTLDKPVNGNAIDGKPLDIYSLLISPAEDGPIHLRRLSRISRLLKNKTLHKRLRETKDRDVMQALFIDPEGWLLAA
ncbi:MAG: PTS sugar transporter subunit IIA [Alphaproteobacteria bacterium]